jgi:adenosylcobinamide amidohydrolase
MKTKRCGSARVCSHELPTATEDKSNTAQQTRATGTARDGVVVLSSARARKIAIRITHGITKTLMRKPNFQERRRGNF